MREWPLVKDLVLVGGGHAHALVLRMWAMRPLPGVRLTLVSPDPATPYTGQLPGLIAGHYRRDEILIDLVRLARRAGARLILDRATGLEPEAQRLHLKGRPPLPYDLASLDIGVTSDLPDLPGLRRHGHCARPLGDYAAAWEAFVARALPRPRLVVIGAGLGGVELALASAHRLRGQGQRPEITLLDHGALLLPGFAPASRGAILQALQAAGVTLRLNAKALAVEAGSVTLAGGEALASDFTLCVAGARPQAWLADSGLALEGGHIRVDRHLQSSDPLVFAAGDCAHLAESPRPKAGVFAVRAAPVLLDNLRARLTGGTLRPFRPQKDYLKLVSLGGQSALAEKWRLRLQGPALWRLKDRIDRAFMAKFQDYPAMERPTLPAPAVLGLAEALGDKPLCGGCGAKVGAEGLAGLLAALPAANRPEVLAGAGDDAAILRQGEGVQVLTTDHLRAFSHDPRLMARLTAVHALGDVWAMGAAPQVALAQIILPPLSPLLQSRTLTEITAGAAEVFGPAGADVVGGHTSQGAELTIGFTVTGTSARALTKGGARPGDGVILTKPLGSGTILAAEMALARLKGGVLGEAVAACHAQMQRPLGPASAVLAPLAHAMTDVTGFGLAGHLWEMLAASGTAARLDLGSIPLMAGAEALAAAGEGSSLAPANRAALLGRITGQGLASARGALLFDPQTCGGLLAALPLAEVPGTLARLHDLGETSACLIARIEPGPPHLTLI